MSTSSVSKAIWLDCDPGHDDAVALLLALYHPSLELLGVSTIHGNASGANTYRNAVRLMAAYGVSPQQCSVWRGADRPLIREAKADVGIHGEDGLGGVVGLPAWDDKGVQDHIMATRFASQAIVGLSDGESAQSSLPPAHPLALVQHQLHLLAQRKAQGLPPITLIATGPLTNVALLFQLCPDNGQLVRETIQEVVLMGGAAGTCGNRSPLAEWNILVDPEAAKVVFDHSVPTVMAGLNVTHQAILTTSIHAELVQQRQLAHEEQDPIQRPRLQEAAKGCSTIRQVLSSAMMFFCSTYAEVFDFLHGPPVHDLLAVAYVVDPTLFYSLQPRPHFPGVASVSSPDANQPLSASPQRISNRRYRVDINCSTDLNVAGTTLVDFYRQWPVEHDGWHRGGRNAIVLEYVDTRRLWTLLLQAVDRAEQALAASG